ncbi:MAG: cytochrome c-type biosis protein CcmE [Bacteroidota bacterium]|nr:cytochrome c-type biosis protein CcmE [Bacteroidota bacterium]
MNKRYIIGGLIIVAFIIIAIFSFDKSKIEYSDFSAAKHERKIVQIIGSLHKADGYTYDSKNDRLTFNMLDEKRNIANVVYKGLVPNNFEIAPMLVIKGKFEGETFMASEILTKCPSKYEGKMEDIMKTKKNI